MLSHIGIICLYFCAFQWHVPLLISFSPKAFHLNIFEIFNNNDAVNNEYILGNCLWWEFKCKNNNFFFKTRYIISYKLIAGKPLPSYNIMLIYYLQTTTSISVYLPSVCMRVILACFALYLLSVQSAYLHKSMWFAFTNISKSF